MFRFIPAAISPEPYTAPLFTERCQACFPSPAQDYVKPNWILMSSGFNAEAQRILSGQSVTQ